MRIILAAILGSATLAGCAASGFGGAGLGGPGTCTPPGRLNNNLVIMEPCGQPIYMPDHRDN